MKPARTDGVNARMNRQRSPDRIHNRAVRAATLAVIVFIAPMIVWKLGLIDRSGCGFEDGCDAGFTLLKIWFLSWVALLIVAVVALVRSAKSRRDGG
jgi:uncharacterized membrane protein